jgi:hypothetical protein
MTGQHQTRTALFGVALIFCGLAGGLVAGFVLFHPQVSPKLVSVAPSAAMPVPASAHGPVDIDVLPEIVDPANPEKGLRLTLNLLPAPGDFDLKVRTRRVDYQVLSGVDRSGSVTAVTTLNDELTAQELARNTGAMTLRIQVFRKGTDQETGQISYAVPIGEIKPEALVEKTNLETASRTAGKLKTAAKDQRPEQTVPPAPPRTQPYQDSVRLARLNQLEEDQKKHIADQEAETDRLRLQLEQAAKKVAKESAQLPAPAPKTVPQIDYASLAMRIDGPATDLTACLRKRVITTASSLLKQPDFPACAGIVMRQQSLLQELLRLPTPPGPFTQLGTLVVKLTNNSWENRDLLLLRGQLSGIRDKLKAVQ